MLDRCYVPDPKQPTYVSCKVTPDWFYFQNFAAWFYDNYEEGQQLDKDIIVKGNTVYSPETCCFVPQEINKLLTDRRLDRGALPQGVSRVTTPTETYQSHISKEGKIKHLGSFKSIESAYRAYKIAKEAYVKELATAYYADEKITIVTFKALMKWEL